MSVHKTELHDLLQVVPVEGIAHIVEGVKKDICARYIESPATREELCEKCAELELLIDTIRGVAYREAKIKEYEHEAAKRRLLHPPRDKSADFGEFVKCKIVGKKGCFIKELEMYEEFKDWWAAEKNGSKAPLKKDMVAYMYLKFGQPTTMPVSVTIGEHTIVSDVKAWHGISISHSESPGV